MRIINQHHLSDFALNHADSIKAINKWAEGELLMYVSLEHMQNIVK